MWISDYLEKDCIVVDLKGQSRSEVVGELLDVLSQRCPQLNRQILEHEVNERERIGTTAVGYGVAIPHAKVVGVQELKIILGIHRKGIHYPALDNEAVRLIFLMIYPKENIGIQLKTLARVSRLMRDSDLREALLGATDAAKVFSVLAEYEEKHFH